MKNDDFAEAETFSSHHLDFLEFPATFIGKLPARLTSMPEQAVELRRRVADFAVAVLRFVRRLPRDVSSDSIIRQVARSAGGVSANYRAACCARSRQEFVAKLGVAVEEADETEHWLWMAGQLNLGAGSELNRLVGEGKELHAILSASLSTARRNLRREAEERKSRNR